MTEHNVGQIISLAGLRKEDMSIADIRGFFAQLPDILGASPAAAVIQDGDGTAVQNDFAAINDEMRGVTDDLTLVFRHALERSVSRRELPPGEPLDGLAESLAMIFRSVVSMSRRGHSADQIREYLDIALGVLD